MNFDDNFLEDKNNKQKTKEFSIIRESCKSKINIFDLNKLLENKQLDNICKHEKYHYNECKKKKFANCEQNAENLIICYKKIRIID